MSDKDLGGSDNNQNNEENLGGSDNQFDEQKLSDVRRAGQREALKVLSKVAGREFNTVKDINKLGEDLAEFNAWKQSQQQESNVDHTKKSTKSDAEMIELRKALSALQTERDQEKNANRKLSLRNQLSNVIQKSGVDPDYSDVVLDLLEKQIDADEDGTWYVKGKNGEPRLDKNGDAVTYEQLTQELLKSRPKFVKEISRSGSGTNFGINNTKAAGSNDVPEVGDVAGYKAWKEQQGFGQKGFAGMTVTVNQDRFK